MRMKEAYSRGFNNVLIETEHGESFRILRRQNYEEASSEQLVEPTRTINACNPLLPSVSGPICRVYNVRATCNQVAYFLASFALSNVDKLVEVDYGFQGMKDLLDNNMGTSSPST